MLLSSIPSESVYMLRNTHENFQLSSCFLLYLWLTWQSWHGVESRPSNADNRIQTLTSDNYTFVESNSGWCLRNLLSQTNADQCRNGLTAMLLKPVKLSNLSFFTVTKKCWMIIIIILFHSLKKDKKSLLFKTILNFKKRKWYSTN